VAYAITEDGELRGVITMNFDARSRCGDLGYWIGQPFWGRGLATEAVRAILDFGFRELGLNRVQASHLSRNPSSGRVMKKAGMVREGVHRERLLKNGVFEDTVGYAILRRDWKAT
jgi:RimJ/RimL family protein N-acetyltransferase